MNPLETPSSRINHTGPNLGIAAIVFTILFNAGLFPVTIFAGKPYFPGATESPEITEQYFPTRLPALAYP